jgi:hypothetical protein
MNKNLIAVLILTLITTLAWIGFRGMVLLRKPSDVSFVGKTVEEISPELRIDVAEEL